ncbi:unnamed protein product [Rangifer tarandus platyrhynchus]|uniref:Uncharacterized protein n=1 Tax=Rangifer tarandus platyrhynchus TaxID=3082113 RepID=A0AC59Z3J2_RANTA
MARTEPEPPGVRSTLDPRRPTSPLMPRWAWLLLRVSLVTKWCLTTLQPQTVAHHAPLSLGFPIAFKVTFQSCLCFYRGITIEVYHRIMLSSNKAVISFSSVWA